MSDPRNELEALRVEAERYFASSMRSLKEAGHNLGITSYFGPELSEGLPCELKQASEDLRKRIVRAGADILDAARSSPLLSAADTSEIRLDVRRIMASLKFREFEYSAPYAVAEEDRVYGMMPEEQREKRASVDAAAKQFDKAIDRLIEKLGLILPAKDDLPRAIVASQAATVRKYRPNTAFIMMQINEGIPKLEDVRSAIKEVFKRFGIEAVRSDEIEHQDVLTQRILDEIATSEFLIADLTGERPSVYYEVGFAHAVGKRPILYREKGTRLHFDLSVHNVPEYENITDLKNKLTKRLEALTNKSAGPREASTDVTRS